MSAIQLLTEDRSSPSLDCSLNAFWSSLERLLLTAFRNGRLKTTCSEVFLRQGFALIDVNPVLILGVIKS